MKNLLANGTLGLYRCLPFRSSSPCDIYPCKMSKPQHTPDSTKAHTAGGLLVRTKTTTESTSVFQQICRKISKTNSLIAYTPLNSYGGRCVKKNGYFFHSQNCVCDYAIISFFQNSSAIRAPDCSVACSESRNRGMQLCAFCKQSLFVLTNADGVCAVHPY